MDSRLWIKSTNRGLRRKLYEQDADTRGFHSWSYHSYFEGYTESYRIDSNGRKRLVREYTGAYYSQKLGSAGYVLLRIMYTLLLAGAVYMFICAGRMPEESGSPWYMILAEFAAVMILSWFVYVLAAGYLFIPKRMTVGDYRASSGAIKNVSFAAAICFACNALLAALNALTGGGESTAKAALLAGCFLASALINIIEKKVVYESSKPEIISI